MEDTEPRNNRNVCNIKSILIIRHISGYYHNIHSSNRIRWFAKLYCLLVPIVLASVQNKFKNSKHMNYLLFFEYFSYVVISLYTEDKYLQNYFTRVPFVDVYANSSVFKRLEKFLNYYILGIFGLKVIVFLAACSRLPYVCYNNQIFFLFDYIICVNVAVGRCRSLMIFALFYCRVKTMTRTLEANGFNNTARGRFRPRLYMNMYESIISSLENSSNSLKLQIVLYVFSSLWYLIQHLLKILLVHLKNNGLDLLFSTWVILEMLFSYGPLLIIVILSDLVTQNIGNMRVIVTDSRIACRDEKKREEFQQLQQLMENSPYEFTLFRIMKLNLRSLLAIQSFCTTIFIAILQIMDFKV